MTLETFLIMLLTVSIFDSLFTEAVKQIFEFKGKPFISSNILAGIIAIFIAIFIYVGYMIQKNLCWDEQQIMCLITLVLLSWLTAMVGYDKVVQAIAQVTSRLKEV